MTRTEVAEATSLAAAVTALQQLDTAALRRRWRALVGGRVPPDLGRPLTLRILAYKLQAQHWATSTAEPARARSLVQALAGAPRRDKVETAGASASPIGAEAGVSEHDGFDAAEHSYRPASLDPAPCWCASTAAYCIGS